MAFDRAEHVLNRLNGMPPMLPDVKGLQRNHVETSDGVKLRYGEVGE